MCGNCFANLTIINANFHPHICIFCMLTLYLLVLRTYLCIVHCKMPLLFMVNGVFLFIVSGDSKLAVLARFTPESNGESLP